MTEKPNIVLINCDDLGYGDLGCYGSKVNDTPVLDSMAQGGIRFNSFYMASPVCSPSRGAMMTGCYPPRIGFGSFDDDVVLFPGQGIGLSQHETTIADILKVSGYSTMLVGKWHCGDQPDFLPTRHGFDHYYGLPYSNDMGIQAGKTVIRPPLPLMLDEEVIQEQPDQTSLTERYVEQAVRFIRSNKQNPFFLYFAHMHVHLPHYTPERFMRQSQNGEYGAAVECIDWATAVILDELKKLGIENNTLVIFTSDNGSNTRKGGSNAPLRGTKTTTWEGGMRVPCIMSWPGRIPEGIVSDALVTSLDFYPTIAHIAGANISNQKEIDGMDISSVIFDGQGAKSPREVFYYYFMNRLEAVRVGKWKLHVRKFNSRLNQDEEVRLLYDLENDISESHNLYNQYPDVVKRLEAYLDECREDLGDEGTGIKGKNIRPSGRVEKPDTLTHINHEHPYIIAMYDKEDFG